VLKGGAADQMEARSGAFPNRKIRARIFPYPNGAAILFVNITDESFKAEQLNHAFGYTAALEASSDNSFLSLNVRGAITNVGRRFSDWLGLSSNELDGIRLEDLVSPKDRRRLNATIEHVMRNHAAEACRVAVLTKEQGLVEIEFAMAALSNGLVAEGLYVIAAFIRGGAAQ
jgi:PAS domain-containing protein